jgi:hypothetical protein
MRGIELARIGQALDGSDNVAAGNIRDRLGAPCRDQLAADRGRFLAARAQF